MNRPPVLDETQARAFTFDTQDYGSSETLQDKPREPAEIQYSRQRKTLSLYLHVALVAIQVFLLVVWHKEWEHRIVFSVDHELPVAQLVKGILTTFITLYSALLVFVTQALALRCDLHRRQLLTATHDNAVAWSGLGSAIVRLWEQRAIPTSPTGVLTALTYLAGISVLHTAFPGVAAPESIVVNQSMPVSTQSLPAFNLSGVDEDNREDFLYGDSFIHLGEAAGNYAGGSLSFLPFLTPSNALGLHEATLYDLLEPNTGTGSVRVNATGFNISCGYIPDTAFNPTAQSVDVGGVEYYLGDADIDVITTVAWTAATNSSQRPLAFPSRAVFYTSISVFDSSNNTAPWINLTHGHPTVQVFRCSLGLVEQTVLVNSQSHNFTSFASETPIEKQTSMWMPFSEPPTNLSNAAFSDGTGGFLDIWEAWYSAMPTADSSPSLTRNMTNAGLGLTEADMALLQRLELYPFNSTIRTSVYLHEVENQLATIVASMFWALGHVPAPSAYINPSQPFNVSLLTGQAMVSEPVIQDHLAVKCLVVSLVLLALSLRFCRLGRQEGGTRKFDGLDVLQTIWLYRDHPELAASLEQVKVPTDGNLRRAGMLRVQLVDAPAYIGQVSDSEEVCEISEDTDGLSVKIYPPEKQASKEPETLGSSTTWTSDLFLSFISTVLHCALVVIHLIIAVLCAMGLEHGITFSLSQQSLVAWLISTVATAFITVYTAGLVFLAQTLSIRQSLRKTQMLTITHDTVAAWRGVGSALTGSAHGSSAIFPMAHYCGSGWFWRLPEYQSLQAWAVTAPTRHDGRDGSDGYHPAVLRPRNMVFNTTIPVQVGTQGIPQFAFSGYEPSSIEARTDALHSPLLYAQGSLSYFPFINSSFPTLGLEGGILYDVLNNSDFGTGTATVDAVQLNMSWGTIKILGLDYMVGTFGNGESWLILIRFWLKCIYRYHLYVGLPHTVPIFDSAGNTGPLVDVFKIADYWGPGEDPDWVRDIQILGCSLGLVDRTISVDAQSRVLSSPWAVRKNSSVWSPIQETGNQAASEGPYNTLADNWESFYTALPSMSGPLFGSPSDLLLFTPVTSLPISSLSRFFIERFNLDSNASSVTLHQFEDALAEVVASMYWTLGHVPPPPDFVPMSLEPNDPPPMEVSLLQGNAVLVADAIEARLDANITFIIPGTVISGVLFLLSLKFSIFRTTTQEEINVMGPLHTIWLHRHHPELEAELEQVLDPTTSNLRKAGLVRTRLAGPRVEHFVE
ncbi:hypothetical protein FB45DRAFT_1008948 [Roridomyces roridus]|uniref:Uncharacterized protein n=1 Tax=Roridomyces roridus TaxID=1738132 RepID=A0AAD7B7Z9_9AGAR|nr:hypothetical protein FB45DRAFT_1008948 [Roridomyces roridus]